MPSHALLLLQNLLRRPSMVFLIVISIIAGASAIKTKSTDFQVGEYVEIQDTSGIPLLPKKSHLAVIVGGPTPSGNYKISYIDRDAPNAGVTFREMIETPNRTEYDVVPNRIRKARQARKQNARDSLTAAEVSAIRALLAKPEYAYQEDLMVKRPFLIDPRKNHGVQFPKTGPELLGNVLPEGRKHEFAAELRQLEVNGVNICDKLGNMVLKHLGRRANFDFQNLRDQFGSAKSYTISNVIHHIGNLQKILEFWRARGFPTNGVPRHYDAHPNPSHGPPMVIIDIALDVNCEGGALRTEPSPNEGIFRKLWKILKAGPVASALEKADTPRYGLRKIWNKHSFENVGDVVMFTSDLMHSVDEVALGTDPCPDCTVPDSDEPGELTRSQNTPFCDTCGGSGAISGRREQLILVVPLEREFMGDYAQKGIIPRFSHRLCNSCKKYLAEDSYSKRQWNVIDDSKMRCRECVAVALRKCCNSCGRSLQQDQFSKTQWHTKRKARCKECIRDRDRSKTPGAPEKKLTRQDSGS